MALKIKRKKSTKKSHTDVYLATAAFIQATGLVVYCLLIGLLIWRGEYLFGPMNNFFGPMLFLVVFVASVLICALLAFGYAIVLFWDKKETRQSVKLVALTTVWLLFYVLLFILFMAWPLM